MLSSSLNNIDYWEVLGSSLNKQVGGAEFSTKIILVEHMYAHRDRTVARRVARTVAELLFFFTYIGYYVGSGCDQLFKYL